MKIFMIFSNFNLAKRVLFNAIQFYLFSLFKTIFFRNSLKCASARLWIEITNNQVSHFHFSIVFNFECGFKWRTILLYKSHVTIYYTVTHTYVVAYLYNIWHFNKNMREKISLNNKINWCLFHSAEDGRRRSFDFFSLKNTT